jgi:hypothetical protein
LGPQGYTGPQGTFGLTGENYSDYIYWNTGTKSFQVETNGTVHIGSNAGQIDQGGNGIAIGYQSGQSKQGINSVAIGNSAGQISQSTYGIAIGNSAGNTGQGYYGVAIGINAGKTKQGYSSISVGPNAGEINQGNNSVAIGYNAGQTGQLSNSIALGEQAAANGQSTSSIAIGHLAGYGYLSGSTTVVSSKLGTSSIAIGQYSGQNEGFGNNTGNTGNMYLGLNTSCSTSGGPFQYSSAIGYNAKITASNQIMLGTTGSSINALGSLGTELKYTILNMIYPVGSIYMNYTSSSTPNTLLGWPTTSGYTSTWVQVKQYTLVGYDSTDSSFNTLGGVGGYANIQPHNHLWYGYDSSTKNRVIDSTNGGNGRGGSYSSNGTTLNYFDDPNLEASYYTSRTIATDPNTNSSNYPPYLIVTMWKRTS